jgi:integrase
MPREPQPPRPALVTEDCFAALVRLFMSPANTKWREPPPVGYSQSTKETWGRELRHMARPDLLGPLSLQEIRPSLVLAYIDGIGDRPGKAVAGLAALRQLEKWAIVRDLLPRQITLGIEVERSTNGHIPWTDEQVALAERHARPDLARAVTLAANTGQRGSDLVRMGPTDIETYQEIDGINVTLVKTGKRVWVPITTVLADAMKGWDRRPGPFLRKLDGGMFDRDHLTNAWAYERDTNPELKSLGAAAVAGKPTSDAGLVLHGLRGTACVRLRRAGATIPQIADMVGMSEEMVARYCRYSLQRENAIAAVHHLERTIKERHLDMSNKNGS